MDAGLATNQHDRERVDADSDSPRNPDEMAPQEVVREVAANLKSLARVLPYAEYAAIVHRIARLRWRCECDPSQRVDHN